MISFTTDDIAPERRFDQWREVRGKSLFGVTIELAAEKRLFFHGSFRAHAVGGAVASEMRASSYRIKRTNTDIARISGNSLCIAHQVTGGGLLDTGRGRADTIHDGDMVVSHSDLPYSGQPDGERGFLYRMLKIPIEGEILLGRRADDLFAAKPIVGTWFLRPFRALFDALMAPERTGSDPSRDVASVARLALAARGRLPLGMPEVRAALRTGVRHAALEIMERDKRLPGLNPARVAMELGISRRQFYVVLEEAGLTFSRTLAAMRVRDARRLLVEIPSLSVTQVAFACGFDSLATFYRAFAATYGMTPSDMRGIGGRWQ